MRIPSRASLGVGLAVAGACAPTTPNPALRLAAGQADSAEYAAFQGDGTQELRGQAFLTTRTGEVKLAAGRLVTLDPVTTYSTRWFRTRGADPSRFEVPAPDPRFAAARRTRNADTEGKFRFTRLKPGSYLVRSLVTWEDSVEAGTLGGLVAALVAVQEGNDEEVILSLVYPADSAAVFGIEILPDTGFPARRHRVLERVTAASCEVESELPARRELVREAARKGADLVARVTCHRRGVDLLRGCASRIECEGDAIAWP